MLAILPSSLQLNQFVIFHNYFLLAMTGDYMYTQYLILHIISEMVFINSKIVFANYQAIRESITYLEEFKILCSAVRSLSGILATEMKTEIFQPYYEIVGLALGAKGFCLYRKNCLVVTEIH